MNLKFFIKCIKKKIFEFKNIINLKNNTPISEKKEKDLLSKVVSPFK